MTAAVANVLMTDEKKQSRGPELREILKPQ